MYENDQRPIFSLTVSEFVELQRFLYKEQTIGYTPPVLSPEKIEQDDIIDVHEASRITFLKVETIYSKVCRSEMKAASSGRPLTFSRKKLIEWMANGRPSVAEMMADDYFKKLKK